MPSIALRELLMFVHDELRKTMVVAFVCGVCENNIFNCVINFCCKKLAYFNFQRTVHAKSELNMSDMSSFSETCDSRLKRFRSSYKVLSLALIHISVTLKGSGLVGCLSSRTKLFNHLKKRIALPLPPPPPPSTTSSTSTAVITSL